MNETLDHLHRQPHFLLLESDETFRRLFLHYCKTYGQHVVAVSERAEAIHALLHYEIDVMAVDVTSLDLNGWTIIRDARSIRPGMGTVVVADPSDLIDALLLDGCDIRRVIRKPVDVSALWRMMKDEGAEQRERQHQPTSESMRECVSQLMQISEQALKAESMAEALSLFCRALSPLVPADMVGVMGLQDEEQILVLNAQRVLAPLFASHVETQVFALLDEANIAHLRRPVFHVQNEGFAFQSDAPATPCSLFTLPVGNGPDLNGLLIIAGVAPDLGRQLNPWVCAQLLAFLNTVMSALRQMRRRSSRDYLTGLFNRASVDEEMQRIWMLANRHRHPISLMMIDLDRFKALNDTHGHMIGDQVLREFSQLLLRAIRSSDMAARYGGDEFLVLLPETNQPEARVIGNRILDKVSNFTFCMDQERLSMTVSIGVACSWGLNALTPIPELIRQADEALYVAKREGRNEIRMWSDQGDAVAEVVDDTAGGVEAQSTPPSEPGSRGRILVVDDADSIRDVLGRILKAENYEIVTEASERDTLNRLRTDQKEFDLVLVDIVLPEGSGFNLLREFQAMCPNTVRIVMTGYGSKENAVTSMREGVFDFVDKPFNRAELLAVVEKAMRYRRLLLENDRYRLNLESMYRERSVALSQALTQLESSYQFMLQALVHMLDAREPMTAHHSEKVSLLVEIMGREFGLTPDEMEVLREGALLHDIGKIGVPDAILLKTESFTEDEWAAIRKHPEIGYEILRMNPRLGKVAELVWSHQERYDGKGYPRGLKGEEICIGARIFAIIDSYDAMRSDRCYRRSMRADKALLQIVTNSGAQFDPRMVEAFVRCQAQIEQMGQWPVGE